MRIFFNSGEETVVISFFLYLFLAGEHKTVQFSNPSQARSLLQMSSTFGCLQLRKVFFFFFCLQIPGYPNDLFFLLPRVTASRHDRVEPPCACMLTIWRRASSILRLPRNVR